MCLGTLQQNYQTWTLPQVELHQKSEHPELWTEQSCRSLGISCCHGTKPTSHGPRLIFYTKYLNRWGPENVQVPSPVNFNDGSYSKAVHGWAIWKQPAEFGCALQAKHSDQFQDLHVHRGIASTIATNLFNERYIRSIYIYIQICEWIHINMKNNSWSLAHLLCKSGFNLTTNLLLVISCHN